MTTIDMAVNRQLDIDLPEFHPNKCYVLTGKVYNIMHTQRYSIVQHQLDHVFEEKDLGVTFDSELKFEEHMSTTLGKGNAIMSLIRRSITFLDWALFKSCI